MVKRCFDFGSILRKSDIIHSIVTAVHRLKLCSHSLICAFDFGYIHICRHIRNLCHQRLCTGYVNSLISCQICFNLSAAAGFTCIFNLYGSALCNKLLHIYLNRNRTVGSKACIFVYFNVNSHTVGTCNTLRNIRSCRKAVYIHCRQNLAASLNRRIDSYGCVVGYSQSSFIESLCIYKLYRNLSEGFFLDRVYGIHHIAPQTYGYYEGKNDICDFVVKHSSYLPAVF